MNYKEIKTYPEMDKNIVEYLAMTGVGMSLYAAKRIEELEAQILKLKAVKNCFSCKFQDNARVKMPCLFCDERKYNKWKPKQ